jgi:type I restriction enzyme M protein
MLRIASMNLWLHGINNPNVLYTDTLSKNYQETDQYDIVLANPPFKGSLDESDVNADLLCMVKTKKTELLFLALILRVLDIGGKAAVIVPDGVLFGSSTAHQAIRKVIVENNQLEGVISMPSGVFKPYAGVSTAILIFTKGGQTNDVWFYDMEHDGYSLDDKRQPIEDCDIPDILTCWKNKKDKSFSTDREKETTSLRDKLFPLKQKRLELNQKVNRLTFESILANDNVESVNSELESTKQELDNLNNEIHQLQRVFNQYSRQFWVTKEQIKANKYDLSASRYRQIEQDEQYYEKPDVTISRMKKLENVIDKELDELSQMISV